MPLKLHVQNLLKIKGNLYEDYYEISSNIIF